MKTKTKSDSAKKAPGPVRLWLSRLSIWIYILSLLGIDLLFQLLYGFVGGASHPGLLAMGFSVLWCLLLGAAAYLLPRVCGRILMIVTVLAAAILAVVHAVMYHLFGSFFRFSDLLYAGEGAAFFSMQYVQMRTLLAVGLIALVAAGITAAVFLPKRAWRPVRFLAGGGVIAACLAGLLVLNHANIIVIEKNTNTMSWSVTNEEASVPKMDVKKQQYTEFLNANACLPMTGLYQYTWRDFTKTFFTDEGKDRNKILAELNAAHDSRPAIEPNEMTGALAGKNLIMVMVESLDTWMITEDYMPNLYALKQKSVYMEHFYTPLYLNAGTFSTEFTSQTGLIPPTEGVSTEAYAEFALPAALPQLFAAEGYRVNSFHSANPSIYNRGKIHTHLGFETYHDFTKMGMEDYQLDSQMLNGFDQMVNREEPFYSFIITYSGHGPYNESMGNIAAPHLEQARAAVAASGVTASEDTMEQYVRAVAHIMETDAFLGGLVDRLEAEGLLEDTVLIIYGDHFCKYLTDVDFLMELKDAPNRNLLCNTPLMIYSPSLEPRVVDKYASTVDLYPTVCNLFGLKTDLRYFAGDDIFGQAGGLVYWNDFSCWDGTTYVNGSLASELSEADYRLYYQARQRLLTSWNTFRYNFFSSVNPTRQ